VFETLELVREGPLARLWLNRPDKLNPLSRTTLGELVAAAEELNRDDTIRVVVVGGRGRCFSAGADLEGFPTPGDAAARGAADAGRAAADALESLRAISIARLHGWCVGGGLVLAAACDLRVATHTTRFSIPEVDLGIPLAWGGIPRLLRELGPALVKELVITCRPFDAEEGQRCGFLNRVTSESALDDCVTELAEAVIARPAYPVAATKQQVDAILRAQVGLDRSWSDADSLLAGLMDPECEAARERYLRAKGRKDG
jgi:enoyl-CoA hydratase/carnithine racemase